MIEYFWTKDTESELYNECLDLRIEVFVKEKNSTMDLEVKDEDQCCFLGVFKDRDLIGTGRIYFENKKEVLFQRIAIKKEFRSQGYGSKMIKEMEKKCSTLSVQKIKICASMHAINFYKRLGYSIVSETFNRGGIDHVMIEKILNKN